MFRPYLAILRQVFTFWNNHTALVLKIFKCYCIFVVHTKIYLFENITLHPFPCHPPLVASRVFYNILCTRMFMILLNAKFHKFWIVVVALILITCVVLFSPMNIGVVLLSLLLLSAIFKDVSLIYVFYIFCVCYFPYILTCPISMNVPTSRVCVTFVWVFCAIVSAYISFLGMCVLPSVVKFV
jgi:hypothetical protein